MIPVALMVWLFGPDLQKGTNQWKSWKAKGSFNLDYKEGVEDETQS